MDSTHHRPADAEAFKFDQSVADVFPDMARRSIPNYELAHQIHSDIIIDHLASHQSENNRILDVGASRGAFFTYLDSGIGQRYMGGQVSYEGIALDSSSAMLRYLRELHPKVYTILMDLEDRSEEKNYPWAEFRKNHAPGKFLVINCMYTLQFLTPDSQRALLAELFEMLHPNGLFLIGTKLKVPSHLGVSLQKAYIHYRLRNGYQIEDINAKSKALRGTMHEPMLETLMSDLEDAGFKTLTSTTRAMVFSTFVCTKRSP